MPPRPLAELARGLALDPQHRSYHPYGHDFAKIDVSAATIETEDFAALTPDLPALPD